MATRRLGTTHQDLLLEPHQTNGYDCGIWVLAQMAAILRGYEVTGIEECDINHFWHFLSILIHCVAVLT
ncbi:hypothetical protein PISMIDRAFT_20283 [Pisolithus microcarpus 441]|uniref:Ubiquitin-like protease family profile domain-containing protein n=1 Tax=Pisolithus microcarpus 441 TaxID=765257 RepID=A0A0C9Y989_9AGAM|nr:hypothetical protein PISMIDRAFT_20283 [Pisolithus microcarpus 441]